jgi:hypothetical protein
MTPAMTLDEYNTAMQGRTTPIGHTMNNTRAERARIESAAIATTTTTETEVLTEMVADRTQRRTNRTPVSTGRDTTPTVCGTPRGYRAHQNKKQPACLACRKAFIAHKNRQKEEPMQYQQTGVTYCVTHNALKDHRTGQCHAVGAAPDRTPCQFEKLFIELHPK